MSWSQAPAWRRDVKVYSMKRNAKSSSSVGPTVNRQPISSQGLPPGVALAGMIEIENAYCSASPCLVFRRGAWIRLKCVRVVIIPKIPVERITKLIRPKQNRVILISFRLLAVTAGDIKIFPTAPHASHRSNNQSGAGKRLKNRMNQEGSELQIEVFLPVKLPDFHFYNEPELAALNGQIIGQL